MFASWARRIRDLDTSDEIDRNLLGLPTLRRAQIDRHCRSCVAAGAKDNVPGSRTRAGDIHTRIICRIAGISKYSVYFKPFIGRRTAIPLAERVT